MTTVSKKSQLAATIPINNPPIRISNIIVTIVVQSVKKSRGKKSEQHFQLFNCVYFLAAAGLAEGEQAAGLAAGEPEGLLAGAGAAAGLVSACRKENRKSKR